MPTTKRSSGFTLIELLVVVTIIGILSSVGFAIYTSTQITARDAKRKQDLKAIATSLEVYHQYHNLYPAASVNSDSSVNWPNLINSNYIIVMPVDPLNTGTHTYRYVSAGPMYEICALLENTQEPVAGNVIAGRATPPCVGTATDRFYHLAGP